MDGSILELVKKSLSFYSLPFYRWKNQRLDCFGTFLGNQARLKTKFS